MSKCMGCNLGNTAFHQIQTVGSGECELLLVGDYPKPEDDASGYPFTGAQYKFLWDLLNQIGVKYYVTYALKCIPIDAMNRRYFKPVSSTYEPCMKQVFEQEVAQLKPKVILTLGQAALEAVTGIRDAAVGDYRERAFDIRVGEFDTKLLATYSPAYVADMDKEVMYNRFIDDVVYACRHAMIHRHEGKYKSVTLTPDQFVRVAKIWVNDPSIEYVSYDTESNGLNPLIPGAKITSFSVCVEETTGYNIFMYHPEIETSDEDRSRVIAAARELLTTKKVISHHAKHEHRFTKVCWGFTPNITEDTMYMSYILHLAIPGISHGLKHLSGRFVTLPPWEEKMDRYRDLFKAIQRVKSIDDDKVAKWVDTYRDIDVTEDDIYRFWSVIKDPNYYIKHEESESDKDVYMWLVPARVMEQYAGMDAIAPLLLTRKFKPQIEADPGLLESYTRMVRCADAFANIELHGCKLIDPDIWSDRYLEVMNKHIEYLKNHPAVLEYERETGKEFSPTSPKCMQTILYDKLKFPVLEYTGTGNPSAGEPALIALIKKMMEDYGEDTDDPRLDFLWHIRDYKKMQKIQNTYFIGLQKLCLERCYDGVHDRWIDVPMDHSGKKRVMLTNYLLHGTDSGRASSNYHTIPHRSDVAKAITSLYYEHGGILFQADHSQLELRVLACLVEKYYGDSALADAYREGQDIHRFNAGRVFNKDPKDIVDAERRFAKTISFALTYGSSERSVAESTGRTPEEVHDLFETFYNNFPGVRAYIEDTHRFATQYGCIRTPMGRVRWIHGSQDPENRSLYNRAMRQAQNQLIQSAGSDLSLATISWFNQFSRTNDLKSQVMNWVHDSITVDAAPSEWIYSYYCILYGMKHLNEKRAWVSAPLGVDVDISPNWSDHFTVSTSHINPDGSWTFEGKGYSYVIEEVLEEAAKSYEILQNDILESKEFTEDVGNGLIAKKSFNLSYDNKTFLEQKRKITLKPKSEKELKWCLEKYALEQSGSNDLPNDMSLGSGDLF